MQFGGQPTPWSETEIEGLRLRSVSQILIQEIGADGPENAEDSARRACGVIQRQADQIVSADARIAELERECSQWRDELRIYRETEDARIAELEAALRRVRRWCMGDGYSASVQVAMQEWIDGGMVGAMPKLTGLESAIEARAGNGGEG